MDTILKAANDKRMYLQIMPWSSLTAPDVMRLHTEFNVVSFRVAEAREAARLLLEGCDRIEKANASGGVADMFPKEPA